MRDDDERYWDDAAYPDDDDQPEYIDDDMFDELYDDDYDDAYDEDIADDTGDDFFEVRTFDSGTFNDNAPRTAARTSYRMPPASDGERITRAPAASLSLPLPLHQRPYTPPMPRRRELTPPPAWWVTLRTLVIVVIAGVLVSTLFSLWTRPDFFSDEFRAGLNEVQATQRVINIQPSPLPTETRAIRIGVVAGHSGRPRDASFESDPGAVCPDGLTELEINEAVAREVVAALRRLEYQVDLLEEFDERLAGYEADVLVSVHTNDCQDYGDAGTGFSAAAASARQTTRGDDEYLLECLIDQYGKTTGLPRHFGLTYDMTDYHTFGEVSADTPTAIIELGFMNRDRLMLTTQRPLLAQGIVNGILCFLQPDLYAGDS